MNNPKHQNDKVETTTSLNKWIKKKKRKKIEETFISPVRWNIC